MLLCEVSVSLRTATLFCRSLSLSARILICSALSDLRFSWGGKDKKGSGQSDWAVELSKTGEYAWDIEGDVSIQCDLWGSEALLPPSYASRSEPLSESGAPSGPFPSVFGECPENIYRKKWWCALKQYSQKPAWKTCFSCLQDSHQNPPFLPLEFWELPNRAQNQAWGRRWSKTLSSQCTTHREFY